MPTLRDISNITNTIHVMALNHLIIQSRILLIYITVFYLKELYLLETVKGAYHVIIGHGKVMFCYVIDCIYKYKYLMIGMMHKHCFDILLHSFKYSNLQKQQIRRQKHLLLSGDGDLG